MEGVRGKESQANSGAIPISTLGCFLARPRSPKRCSLQLAGPRIKCFSSRAARNRRPSPWRRSLNAPAQPHALEPRRPWASAGEPMNYCGCREPHARHFSLPWFQFSAGVPRLPKRRCPPRRPPRPKLGGGADSLAGRKADR